MCILRDVRIIYKRKLQAQSLQASIILLCSVWIKQPLAMILDHYEVNVILKKTTPFPRNSLVVPKFVSILFSVYGLTFFDVLKQTIVETCDCC